MQKWCVVWLIPNENNIPLIIVDNNEKVPAVIVPC